MAKTKKSTGHIRLTEAMREAAERYAARLMKKGMSAAEASTEANRLAELNLLTAAGYRKRGTAKPT